MYQNWVRQDNVDKEDWCWVLIVSRTNCQGWAGWWDAVRHSDGWNWWHRCHPPVTVIRNFLPLLPPTPQAWAIWFWFVLFNIYNQEKQSYERPQPASCIDDIAKVRKDKFALLWGEAQSRAFLNPFFRWGWAFFSDEIILFPTARVLQYWRHRTSIFTIFKDSIY